MNMMTGGSHISGNFHLEVTGSDEDDEAPAILRAKIIWNEVKGGDSPHGQQSFELDFRLLPVSNQLAQGTTMSQQLGIQLMVVQVSIAAIYWYVLMSWKPCRNLLCTECFSF